MKHRSWQAIPRRYTFVDAHTVDPWVFGFPEVALERDEMEDWRREALRRPQPNPRLYYDERHDLDADGGETIRFMSIGEYAPEAGPGELEEEVHGRYEAYPQDTGAEWVMEWKE
ncbi:hypothetical protein CspHIS471_0311210 [Cutaneotrichosporon sp. HIS471]|nr:hypothetical protein CspHIS471_0311210 [Cutaneotrichosporon sp. HIS471]